MNKSIAGIVLYNPDIVRLAENVNAISPQVDTIIFVDNHSSNVPEVKKKFSDSKYVFIENSENLGIAKALNQICYYAFSNGYSWVLTLDQDSVACVDLMATYNEHIKDDAIGLLTCRIVDRNFVEHESLRSKTVVVKSAITSGSYINLRAWKQIGGFDEIMFIDFVDNDFCMSLIENTYKILKINSVNILHELGNSRKIWFLNQVLYNHSDFRYYYITRNRIYYAKKHKHSESVVRNVAATLWRDFLILAFEGNKLKNCKAIIKGLRDGAGMKIS